MGLDGLPKPLAATETTEPDAEKLWPTKKSAFSSWKLWFPTVWAVAWIDTAWADCAAALPATSSVSAVRTAGNLRYTLAPDHRGLSPPIPARLVADPSALLRKSFAAGSSPAHCR